MKNILKNTPKLNVVLYVLEIICFAGLISQIVVVSNTPSNAEVSNGLLFLIIANAVLLWTIFKPTVKKIIHKISKRTTVESERAKYQLLLEQNIANGKQNSATVESAEYQSPTQSDSAICDRLFYDNTSYVLCNQFNDIAINKTNCIESAFQVGRAYSLRLDPKNSNAVQITDTVWKNYDVNKSDNCYGYLNESELKEMSIEYINSGYIIRAISLDKPLTKVNVKFYIKQFDYKQMLKTEHHISINLLSPHDEEIEDDLQYAELFQEIEIEECTDDGEEPYYYVSNPFEYGKIPTRYSEMLDKLSTSRRYLKWFDELSFEEIPICIKSINKIGERTQITIAVFDKFDNKANVTEILKRSMS